MGSATTIFTDKTGKLMANRIKLHDAYIVGLMLPVSGAKPVGLRVQSNRLGNLIGVCTMDESGFEVKDDITVEWQNFFRSSTGAKVLRLFQGSDNFILALVLWSVVLHAP